MFDQGLMGYAVWDDDLVLDGDALFEPLTEIEIAFAHWRNHPTATLDKMQMAKIRQFISPEVRIVPSLRLLLRQ